jgi:hypothetical protein
VGSTPTTVGYSEGNKWEKGQDQLDSDRSTALPVTTVSAQWFIALVTGAGLFLTTSQAQVMAEVSDAVREIEVTRIWWLGDGPSVIRRATSGKKAKISSIAIVRRRFQSPSHQIGFIALVTGAGLFLTTSQAQVMAEVSDAV